MHFSLSVKITCVKAVYKFSYNFSIGNKQNGKNSNRKNKLHLSTILFKKIVSANIH